MLRRADVIGYLQAQGWQPREDWRNGHVWSHGEFDVLVPGAEVADFEARMRALVRCVADAEQRTMEIVARDIVSGGVDVIGYRAGDEFSLDMGAAALTALRSLLTACANQAAVREISTRTLRGEAVSQLLAATRLMPRDGPFGFDIFLSGGPGSRLGRSSAVRLLDVAALVGEVASLDSDMAFGLVREIRYETIEAFGALGSADRNPTQFELSFHWSRQVPRPDVAVEFTHSAVSRLPELRDTAVDLPPSHSERRELHGGLDMLELSSGETPLSTVEGAVVGLDNDGGPKAIVRGLLWVGDTSTGRQRRITVRLRNADEYAVALAAHSSGAQVRATGSYDGKRDLEVSENGFAVVEGDGS